MSSARSPDINEIGGGAAIGSRTGHQLKLLRWGKYEITLKYTLNRVHAQRFPLQCLQTLQYPSHQLMRNAPRSIYLSFYAISSIVARAVKRAPHLPLQSDIDKRAIAEHLSKEALGGYVVFIILLVVLSGITAGLTLGLMSLDETQLYVLAQSGSPKQKKHAAKIIPIRKNGHLLLVSLLLLNVVSNETLPIISEKVLGSGVISVVISTVMIVIFSEILPQAICSTHGLAIGAAMAVPVKIAIIAMFIVAWPIAKLLDLILGENHGMVYRRAELKELIDFHSKQAQHGGDLSIDAVTVIRGALDLQEKKVKNSMTMLNDVFMLDSGSKLDRVTIQKIVESGHSRVPIFEFVEDEASVADFRNGLYGAIEKRKAIVGCLLAKNLLLLDPDDAVPLSKVSINHIPSVQDDLPLFDILNIFQEGRSHIAIVVDSPVVPLSREVPGTRRSSDDGMGGRTPRLWTDEEMSHLEPIGIITLEDVLEELIQEPIWDETDTAQPRPRAGLAIPLQGTGESLILTTTRGRTVVRNDQASTKQADNRFQGTRSTSSSPQSVNRFEMVAIQHSTTQIERDLANYRLSRSNSAAPADAKVPSSATDPFADVAASLIRQNTTLRHEGSLVNLRSSANKQLESLKAHRPMSSKPLTSGTAPTGFEKNRFKSRSTSSSATNGSGRRTQSAHAPSSHQEHSSEIDSPLRHGTFNDSMYGAEPDTGANKL